MLPTAFVPLLALLAQDPGAAPAAQSQPAASPPAAGVAAASQPAQSAPAPLAPVLEPAALARFEQLCLAIEGPTRLPQLAAFELDVEILTRAEQGTNNDDALISWSAPDRLRFALRSGRVQGHGPSGYWMRDDKQRVELKGREFVEDRRQIDEQLALCRNFATLVRPRSWQLERLVLLRQAPSELSDRLRATALALDWLELASPSFELPGETPAGGPAKRYLVQVGLERALLAPAAGASSGAPNPDAHRARIVCIHERRDGVDVGEPWCLVLDHYATIDGLLVPKFVFARRPDVARAPWQFEEEPSTSVYIGTQSRIGSVRAETDFDS